MKRLLSLTVLIAIMSAALVRPASAQSRPLVTEDPETVPPGFILLEAGFEHWHGAVFPASGLTGDLWKIGTFGLSIGVSSLVELQVDGGLRNRLKIKGRDLNAPLAALVTATGDSTSSIEDLSIGAKIRFISETETRPAIALRFATRLPNSSNESGLGLDTFDFNIGLAAAKTVQSVRIAANLGVGTLGDPTTTANQNNVISFGASVARAVAPGAEVVGEFNGRLDVGEGDAPAGTESRSAIRVGARLTRGPVRLDGGFLIGVTDKDPSWGLTVGATWVFKAFTVK